MSIQTKVSEAPNRGRLVFLALGVLLLAAAASAQPARQNISKINWEAARVIASGEVRPIRYVRLTSDVRGHVKEIYVTPGERVEKGQALCLVEEPSGVAKDVKQYSPLKGIVVEVSARVGEMVSNRRGSSPLMMIADMATINVEIAVDDSEINLVRVGQPARIIVDAFQETEISGVVSVKRAVPLRSKVEATGNYFIVVVAMRDIPSEIRNRLLPGMSATAWIQGTGNRKRCQSVENLVTKLADSFTNKTMGTLDADRPYVGRFTIRIEHSLADDDDPQRFEVRRFSSFARAEQWFKSREIEGMPGRYSRPVEKCARGVCTYNLDGGINHNSLYLKRITYGIRHGCPYLKTIYVLDGD